MVYVNLFGVKCNRRDNFPQGNDNLLGDLGRLPWAVRRDTGPVNIEHFFEEIANVQSSLVNCHLRLRRSALRFGQADTAFLCAFVVLKLGLYGLAGPLSASDKPRKNFLPLANTMFLPTARVDPSFAW